MHTLHTVASLVDFLISFVCYLNGVYTPLVLMAMDHWHAFALENFERLETGSGSSSNNTKDLEDGLGSTDSLSFSTSQLPSCTRLAALKQSTSPVRFAKQVNKVTARRSRL